MDHLVIIQNRQTVTSSTQVADSFEKRHDNVLRDIESFKKDVLNFEEMFFEADTPDSYGRPRRTYLMNRDGFTLLAMGFTGKKAILFKLQYIQAFNQMEQKLFEQNRPSYEISDPVSRAEKWIEEEKQRLMLAAKVEEQKPKVLFAEAIQASKTTILIGEYAKILKQNGIDIGQKRLFEWLRDNGYLIKRKGSDYNTPTQKSMELNLFEIKETPIYHSSGEISISRTSKITGKGQAYFINKFLTKVVAI
ncbi:phage antirepressor KilAC domain-containing protein [Lysinibacillus sp. NPDC097162]|uniref:phage antirepressor KilAC domain-containing protein n=1 Tax=Lysinibacillus sp. NPDC097162 TaxID=3364140 RepID=UPI003803A085